MIDSRAYHRLSELPLFELFAESDLRLLVESVVRRVQVAKGTMLYLQGEHDRIYYILDRGAARLLRVEADGFERVLRELRPGEAIGENALLVGESRDTTLEATQDSTFFLVEHDAFRSFVADHPSVAARLNPRQEVRKRRESSHLSWLRPDEVTLRGGRRFGWTLTTRRIFQRDLLGSRQVILRRLHDVRARYAPLVGRLLDVGRVVMVVEGGMRLVWRGVWGPQRLADKIFTEVGRDRARAHAESLARARRALPDQQTFLPLKPATHNPRPLRSGEDDHIAMGLWRIADWLAGRLLPFIAGILSPSEQESSRSSHQSSL